MKTSRDPAFFIPRPSAKQPRVEEANLMLQFGIFGLLPRELWLEILPSLDKSRMQTMREVCLQFRQLIDEANLVAQARFPRPDHARLFFGKSVVDKKVNSDDKKLFLLDSGDVVIRESGIRLHVLEPRKLEWRVYEPEVAGSIDAAGVFNRRIHKLRSLRSGLQVALSDGGVSVLREYAVVQQLASMYVHEVLELPNGNFVCDDPTGNVHLWKKNPLLTGLPYEFVRIIANPSDTAQGIVCKLTSCGNDIICQYFKCVARFSGQSGDLIECVSKSSLKTFLSQSDLTSELALKLGSEKFKYCVSRLDECNLVLSWEMPNGYAVAKIGLHQFLFKPFDRSIKPFYLGNAEIKLTRNGEVVVFDRDASLALAGWRHEDNQFYFVRILSHFKKHKHKITPSGELLFKSKLNTHAATVYNPFSGSRRRLELKEPEDVSCFYPFFKYLANGDIVGLYHQDNSNNEGFLIFDEQTGQCKSRIHIPIGNPDTIRELPSGDLLNDKLKQGIDVYRFGAKS